MIITKIKGSIVQIMNVSVVTIFVGYIPVIGIPLSMIAMALVIAKLTDTKIWPKAILTMLITFILLRMTIIMGNYAFRALQ
jgi:hypothetical protein